MANTQRGEVSIKLDKERVLRLQASSMIKAEKILGFPIIKLSDENLGIEAVRTLLWASLLHEQKDLTLEETEDLMDMGDWEDIYTKVSELIVLVFQKGSNQTGKK